MLDPIRRIEAICRLHGMPPGAAALQFSMRDPRVTATICGVTRPERVKQTVDWARFPISRRGVGGIESRALFDRRPRGDARL